MPSHIPERQTQPCDDNAHASEADATASSPEEALGEAQAVQLAYGLPRLLLTVATNLLVLGEVFIAMYFAAKNPDEITPVFFKLFFSMLLPTLILAFILKRIITLKGKR
ncbi:MAG: hypothetical protein LBD42_06930 [Desulfovibrio sp.]|jgi:hypothetical protein|nr:hypothetical protein [Desulfovibrio sp.]